MRDCTVNALPRFEKICGGASIRGRSCGPHQSGAEQMADEPISRSPNAESSGVLIRKLSTILSADVAEFSRLMGEDEEGTLKTFRGHKKVFESLVAMHRRSEERRV